MSDERIFGGIKGRDVAAAITIVDHGTEGSDGIARGIPLRWVPSKQVSFDNATLDLQPHDGEARITLSRPVPRIILGLILRPDTFVVEVVGRQHQPLHIGG